MISIKCAPLYQKVADKSNRENVYHKEEVPDHEKDEHGCHQSGVFLLHAFLKGFVTGVTLAAPFVEDEVAVDLPAEVEDFVEYCYSLAEVVAGAHCDNVLHVPAVDDVVTPLFLQV